MTPCFVPQVDGKTNPKIQSIHLDRFPVHKAQFSQDGETVIATSLKNKMFYLYDMMEGRVTPVHTVRGESGVRGQEESRATCVCLTQGSCVIDLSARMIDDRVGLIRVVLSVCRSE